MLKLHLVEVFLRAIPEFLLIICGIHIIVKKSINMKIYILTSLVMGLVAFFVRMLPIYFGVHTFIIIILVICTMVVIGIPLVKSIYGTLLMFLILSLSEFLNLALLNLLNINVNVSDSITKTLLGIPALIIMCLFVLTIRYFTNGKECLESTMPK